VRGWGNFITISNEYPDIDILLVLSHLAAHIWLEYMWSTFD
jgi:hypothetical protein